MLNACGTALTDRLLCRSPTAQAHRAVYIYGFELSLSSLAVMGSVFILSCLCGAVYTSITFSLIFVSIRLFSGGYHAKTYGRCFILSNGVYLACLGMACLIQTLRITFLCPAMILLSMAVVFVLAPMKNKNHPLMVIPKVKESLPLNRSPSEWFSLDKNSSRGHPTAATGLFLRGFPLKLFNISVHLKSHLFRFLNRLPFAKVRP